MNDRELLELAARAAGFTGYGFFLGDDGIDVSDETGTRFAWNPLTDDGDALRLAVKRGLVVTPDRENQRTLVSNQAGHEYCAIYWDNLGEMAATRLAITEVAAEIGKSMGGGE
ncbi:hypothetical protein ACLBSY_25295 [Pseudomonas aeruginosa]|uniref:hypothetical protein n=1 Tax=Pseudomonas aeruginosa TaxID=287 RepID=UPI0039695939